MQIYNIKFCKITRNIFNIIFYVRLIQNVSMISIQFIDFIDTF